MPRVIVTEGATRGLRRCREFLVGKSPEAARRAAQTIKRHFAMLETTPAMGRPVQDEPDMHELVIGFGASGYVALYSYDRTIDTVYVLAFRHQREAGY